MTSTYDKNLLCHLMPPDIIVGMIGLLVKVPVEFKDIENSKWIRGFIKFK